MLSIKTVHLNISSTRNADKRRLVTRVRSSTSTPWDAPQNEDPAGSFSSQETGAKEYTLPRSEETRKYFRTVSHCTGAMVALLLTGLCRYLCGYWVGVDNVDLPRIDMLALACQYAVNPRYQQ